MSLSFREIYLRERYVRVNRGNSRQNMERGAPERAGRHNKGVDFRRSAYCCSTFTMPWTHGISLFKTKNLFLKITKRGCGKFHSLSFIFFPFGILNLAPGTLLYGAPVAVESSGQSLIHS